MAPDPKNIFENLLLPSLDRLYGLALRLTASGPDAEDLVAESCLTAWKKFGQLKDQSKFHPWIGRIITNTYISTYRRAKGNKTVSLDAIPDFSLFDQLCSPLPFMAANPEQDFLAKIIAADISRAVDQLPEVYRMVVVLCDLEEFSYQEVAIMLKAPLGTVRSRLHRGRSLLQKSLWQWGREQGYV